MQSASGASPRIDTILYCIDTEIRLPITNTEVAIKTARQGAFFSMDACFTFFIACSGKKNDARMGDRRDDLILMIKNRKPESS
jgi:hypothetical protein